MDNNPEDSQSESEILAPYLEEPLHIFVRDKVLREQLAVILAILGFINVKVHPTEGSYLDNVRRLAALVVKHSGIFLINPPVTVYGQGGKGKVTKQLPEFFADMNIVLQRTRKGAAHIISRCVPVFPDIQFTEKREIAISALAGYGVTGCFILKPQESLSGLNPNIYRAHMKEQIMQRLDEIRGYLEEYLPNREGAFERLMLKREERELSEHKQEAEAMMRDGKKARAMGNFEQAIECFKRAIDTYPQDPEAYLESGRIYVQVKQYPKALLRFAQAEEVAESIPEPNKEIGNVRVEQVKERVDAGESPESPGIMALLEEALENFQIALRKAELIQARNQEREAGFSGEVVSRLASEIMRLDLKDVLGKNHPMARRFGELARESFKKIASEDAAALEPRQILFLGLAAMDDKNWQEAEEHFFEAAQYPEVFSDACNEIMHLGIVVRKRVGASKAIEIYRKLLDLSPPNRAAVYYNLAVSYSVDKKVVDSAGAIVVALYTDPSLCENEMFYNNPHLNKVLYSVDRVFALIDHRMSTTRVPMIVSKNVHLQEKFERLIAKKDRRTFRLLQHIVELMPDFFLREQVASSKLILNYLRTKREQCRQGNQQETRNFGDFLDNLVTDMRQVPYAKRLVAYNKFKAQCLRILDMHGQRAEAAGFLSKAAVCHPEYVDKPEFYANQRLNELAKEISNSFGSLDRKRIKR